MSTFNLIGWVRESDRSKTGTLMAAVIFLGACSAVYSQDDPFDDAVIDESRDNSPNLDLGTATTQRTSDNPFDVNERNATVLSLRAFPPKTIRELARAAMLMSRIRRWDEVGRWLNEIEKRGITPSTAAEMTSEVGTKTFLSIANRSELTEKQIGIARQIIDLSSANTTDPNLLRKQIERLASDKLSERVQGLRNLQAAGNSGITAFLNSILKENAASPSAVKSEAFSLLGPRIEPAWQAAMSSPHADARERLIRLVLPTIQPWMTPDLASALWDSKMSSELQSDLSLAIEQQNKSIPDVTRVHRFVIEKLQNELAEFDKNRYSDEPITQIAWRISDDGRSLAERAVSNEDSHLIRAAQLALASLRLGARSDIESALAVAVVLESESRSSDGAHSSVLDELLPASVRDGHDFDCLVFDAAVRYRLVGAQSRAVARLGRWATNSAMPETVRSRLVAATKSGSPRVRFSAAALLAIAYSPADENLQGFSGPQPEVGFDGRHRWSQTLAEMKRLEASPLALVIGGSTSLRTHVTSQLEQFAFRTIESANVADVFEAFRIGQPIEAVFIVEHLRDTDLGQLVQRIRGNPSTSTVPIALLAASLSNGEHSVAGSDRKLVMGSVLPQLEGMGDILRRMRLVDDSPGIDANERIIWRDIANEYFEHARSKGFLADKKTYPLAVVDSATGQKRLLEVMGDNRVPLPKREQASQIFVQSVRQFGLLISSETANAQYDVYNERGESEPTTRKLLGRALDAMEAGSGNRPWTDIAP